MIPEVRACSTQSPVTARSGISRERRSPARTPQTCQLPGEMLGARRARRAGLFLTQKRLNDWHAHDSEVLRQEAAQDSGSWRDPGMCCVLPVAARQATARKALLRQRTNRCPEVQTLS